MLTVVQAAANMLSAALHNYASAQKMARDEAVAFGAQQGEGIARQRAGEDGVSLFGELTGLLRIFHPGPQ